MSKHAKHGPPSNPTQPGQEAMRAASGEAAAASPRGSFTPEDISRRAFEIFLARGGEHGRDRDDWLQAERELRLGRQ